MKKILIVLMMVLCFAECNKSTDIRWFTANIDWDVTNIWRKDGDNFVEDILQTRFPVSRGVTMNRRPLLWGKSEQGMLEVSKYEIHWDYTKLSQEEMNISFSFFDFSMQAPGATPGPFLGGVLDRDYVVKEEHKMPHSNIKAEVVLLESDEYVFVLKRPR